MVSDSAFVRIKIVSPELKEFPVADSVEPKTEFPQGLVATFYNKTMQVESTLTAGYAIYHTKRKLFEASKDVVIKNFSQDQDWQQEVLPPLRRDHLAMLPTTLFCHYSILCMNEH